MDAAGIDLAVLSISTVANLQKLEPAEGTALARGQRPARRGGRGRPQRLAACLPRAPGSRAAADELDRAIGALGLAAS